jgi:hypothetical protein
MKALASQFQRPTRHIAHLSTVRIQIASYKLMSKEKFSTDRTIICPMTNSCREHAKIASLENNLFKFKLLGLRN